MIQGIHWIGHASFRIEDGIVIYIDPWQVKNPVPADLVLISHGHRDHLSPEDLAAIAKPDTVYVCAAPYADQIEGDVLPISPGETVEACGVTVKAVVSYNTNKPNHPASAGNVGFIVEVGGRRIYHAGDTDLIPEMSEIACDVALLPMGGKYTMDAPEAAKAVQRIKPAVVIPMHWGRIVGTPEDVERFKELVPGDVEVVVLTPEG